MRNTQYRRIGYLVQIVAKAGADHRIELECLRLFPGEVIEAVISDEGLDTIREHGTAGLRAEQLQARILEDRDQVREPGRCGHAVDDEKNTYACSDRLPARQHRADPAGRRWEVFCPICHK
jgi:hypothetical protein